MQYFFADIFADIFTPLQNIPTLCLLEVIARHPHH
jgi:hypothetical protein